MYRTITTKIFLVLILSMSLITSCSLNKVDEIPTVVVKKQSYIDKITVVGEIESAKSYSISCPGIWGNATVSYLIEDGTYVKEGDTVCILESTELETQYGDALKNYETSKLEYNKSKVDLDLKFLLLQSQVETIDASTSITKLDSVQHRFASSIDKKIIELKLKQAEIEKEKILKELEFLEKINIAELQKMKLRIKQQQTRLDRAQEQLDKLVLTSSAQGIALRERSWMTGEKVKEGDVVRRRFPLVKLPDLSKLQVKLALSEAHFKRVNKKQKVIIKIDAVNGLELSGEIKYKEPVGKPLSRDSKVKVFSVIASIDSNSREIIHGVTANCDIVLNELTDTLLVPSVAVFETDSSKEAYVKRGKYFEKRTVELIYNNNNISVVKSGLKEDDIVALIKPPESLIKTFKIDEESNYISDIDSTAGKLQ